MHKANIIRIEILDFAFVHSNEKITIILLYVQIQFLIEILILMSLIGVKN